MRAPHHRPRNETVSAKGPPVIGLALGSGAARGWAHVGVLRALAEIGVVPDIVAGTSMGAIVGGCYCAGLLDKLEENARRLTRRQLLGLLDLNFRRGGLFSGSKLARLFESEMKAIRIETLVPRFVCVAAELGGGHEVWLRRGSLVNALRASYAIPGIFQPVLLGNRWLIDGAVVNPVPVSVCRSLGAGVVIAVNLYADVFDGNGTVIEDHSADDEPAGENGVAPVEFGNNPRKPPSLPAVLTDAYKIIQSRMARSRLAGAPPDVLIGPRLGGVGHLEFHRAADAIAIGYETCRRAATDIAAAVRLVA